MADAPKINPTDTLRESYPKLNQAIDNANEALRTANSAKSTADTAKTTADSVRQELNQIVIEGDSSVEAAQARVSYTGTTYTTLKERLDQEHESVTTQLADIMGLNNFSIIPTYTNDLLTKVEEKDGDTIKSMSTITYNSDGTVKSVTDTLNGKSVIYTFNYVNDQLQSISRQVGV